MASEAGSAPRKTHRKGITLLVLLDPFPDETAAVHWFEKTLEGINRCCGHCGSVKSSEFQARALLAQRLPQ